MKRFLILLILLVACQVKALDTTEEFSHGLSDMELYSAKSETENSWVAVIGYGHSRWINPSLAVNQVRYEHDKNMETTVSAGNFSQIYSGGVDIGLLVGIDFHDKKEAGVLGTEWTLPYFSWTPYFKHFSHFAESHESTISVGLSWKATAKSELFGETQWDVGQGAHQCVALGWNFKNGPDIEFVSEVGYVFEGSKIYGSLGLIWTRE